MRMYELNCKEFLYWLRCDPFVSNSRPVRIEDTDVFGSRQKYCGYMVGV